MKLPAALLKLFPWLAKPKPAPQPCLVVPPGPLWFQLGGWSVERHVIVTKDWSAMPWCWVSPNRKHAWVWTGRVTPRLMANYCNSCPN